MEIGIFCLLVLWGFQTVFADHPAQGGDDSYIPHDSTLKKTNAALETSMYDYLNKIDAAKPKGTGSDDFGTLMDNCQADADKKTGWEEKFKTASAKCDQYYKKAEKTKNTKVADKKCDKIVADLMSVRKLNIDDSVGCFKKCLQPIKDGAYCKKILQKP